MGAQLSFLVLQTLYTGMYDAPPYGVWWLSWLNDHATWVRAWSFMVRLPQDRSVLNILDQIVCHYIPLLVLFREHS